MTALSIKRMTVPQFLAWAEKLGADQRYELISGVPVAMAPERTTHGRTKHAVAKALEAGIERAHLNCEMLPDGATVIIDEHTAYEPDALVYCGERLPGDALAVPNPVIIVEITSPTTSKVDTGAKLAGYFRVASVRHYLIIDPSARILVHHRRGEDGVITTSIIGDGSLELVPPGIRIGISELFPRD